MGVKGLMIGNPGSLHFPLSWWIRESGSYYWQKYKESWITRKQLQRTNRVSVLTKKGGSKGFFLKGGGGRSLLWYDWEVATSCYLPHTSCFCLIHPVSLSPLIHAPRKRLHPNWHSKGPITYTKQCLNLCQSCSRERSTTLTSNSRCSNWKV